jgi:cell division initiation protein
MALTPVEIRHVKLRRRLLGYDRSAVDRLLEEVIASFEDVWRERADLSDRIEHLEADLTRYRDLEGLLRATLVTAERTATELKEQAQREADLIMSEAHAASRSIKHGAAEERERLLTEAARARAVLRAALGTVEEIEDIGPPRAAAA